MSAEELSKLQLEDKSLEAVRRAAKREVSTVGRGFFERDGLINFTKEGPHLHGQGEGEMTIDHMQLLTRMIKF